MLHNGYLAPWQTEHFLNINMNLDGKLVTAQFHRSDLGVIDEEDARKTFYLRDADKSPENVFLHPVDFVDVPHTYLGEAVIITESLYRKIGDTVARSPREINEPEPRGFV